MAGGIVAIFIHLLHCDIKRLFSSLWYSKKVILLLSKKETRFILLIDVKFIY